MAFLVPKRLDRINKLSPEHLSEKKMSYLFAYIQFLLKVFHGMKWVDWIMPSGYGNDLQNAVWDI